MKRLIRRNFRRIRLNRSKKLRKKQLLVKLKDWSIRVRTRDGFRCLACGSSKNTHAHHLISKSYHPRFALVITNGLTLCKRCHLGKGGVHKMKTPPRNTVVESLRKIYRDGDILKARVFLQRVL
jgi:5-methylcytosine-specific restriction endonuclease McrA